MSGPRKGIVHQYTSRLTAFEHTPNLTSIPPQNLIIFVGGLFDGLLTVPYPSAIADSLPATWSVAQVHLSSSYTGWGTSSLQRDVKELSKCVSYFRRIKTGKVALLGHSTGCQDLMEYLTGRGHEERAPIDGGIIQAPASDREAIVMQMEPEIYEKSCDVAKAMLASGKAEEMMPSRLVKKVLPCPVTARRWLSLASPNHDGDDDYFSSDLTDEQLLKTFGKLPKRTPLCILISGEDEYMPKTIDKNELLERWVGIVKRGEGRVDEENSGVMEGASHNLAGNPDDVVGGLVERVLGFLSGLEAKSNL